MKGFFGFVLVAVFSITLFSCLKNKVDVPSDQERIEEIKKACATPLKKAPQAEVEALEAFLADSSITATKHDSAGFYYVIHEAGNRDSIPEICSRIRMGYKGMLTNNTVFDGTNEQRPSADFDLFTLIEGWKWAVPLVGKGGKLTVYLPPSLGYGSTANGPIPANSILIFDIELIDYALYDFD